MKIAGNTLTVSLTNVPLVDQFQFPGGAGQNLGIAGTPATVSFTVTYVKSGAPREVQPTSADPLSPFGWRGRMWTATNSGTFSAAYSDGSFSASGSFSSSGNFGEMGTERNGSFVGDGQQAAAFPSPLSPLVPGSVSGARGQRGVAQLTSFPALKGKVPLTALVH